MVEEQRRRFVIQNIPKPSEIFRVEPELGGDLRHGDLPGAQGLAMRQRRAQVFLDWQATVAATHGKGDADHLHDTRWAGRSVAGIEGLDRGDFLVGPVALGRLLGEGDTIRQQHRVLSDVLASLEVLREEARRHH